MYTWTSSITDVTALVSNHGVHALLIDLLLYFQQTPTPTKTVSSEDILSLISEL
jgi:hypothetical protein